MAIGLTDEDDAQAAAVRGWAERHVTPGVVRAALDAQAESGLPPFWQALADQGLPGLHIPEEHGGQGAGLVELSVALEELGARAAPGPFLPTALASAVILASSAIKARDELLPGLADGSRTGAVFVGRAAGGPAVPGSAAPAASLTGRRQGDALVIRGAAEPVLGATMADVVVLPVASAAVGAGARALDEAGTGVAAAGTDAATDGAGHSADGARLAAAIAAVLAPDAAVTCAQDCIQVHGGIGYTWEHGAHIYYRRALTLRALTGSSAAWANHVAALALRGAQRELDIDLPADAGPLREQIAAEIAAIAALPRDEQTRRLAADGLVMPHLPKPWGRGAGPLEQVLIQQEMRAAGVRPPGLVIGAGGVASLAGYGTPEQHARFLPPPLRGEIVWCQLFSEPGSGSDLASLQMRSVRAAGGWKLTGQKTWTSLARQAEGAICLARTDPARPKHEGITYFLVDMRSPGIEVRPLTEMTGEELFNEVFFDDVFVPDDMVVGEVNEGWKVARNTLGNERVSLSSSATAGVAVKELLDAAPAPEPAPPPSTHPARLGGEGQALALLELRVPLAQLSGP